MKLYHFAGILVMVVIMSSMGVTHADKFSDTVGEFKKSPIVQPFFKNAYGYAVFPTVGKGGTGSDSGSQAKTSYRKGMSVFTYAKGGLMYEATIGGQKFSFESK